MRYVSDRFHVFIFTDSFLLKLFKAERDCTLYSSVFHDQSCFLFFFWFTLKVGIRPEGIKELFGADIPGFTGDLGFNDFQSVLKVVRCSLIFHKECHSYRMCFMTAIEKKTCHCPVCEHWTGCNV